MPACHYQAGIYGNYCTPKILFAISCEESVFVGGTTSSGTSSGTALRNCSFLISSSPCNNLESAHPRNCLLTPHVGCQDQYDQQHPRGSRYFCPRKSPVFFTPPTTWLPPPPKDDDSPPPLGF